MDALDWKPIDTAPRDGRFIALRLANGGETWGDWDDGWCLENWSIPVHDAEHLPVQWAALPANLPDSFYESRPGENLFPSERYAPDRRLPALHTSASKTA